MAIQTQDRYAPFTSDLVVRGSAKARSRHRSFLCSAVIVGVLWYGPRASCIPVSALNLQWLCDSSDLVVVGRLGSFAQVGQEPVEVGDNTELADLEQAHVEVLHVLKGGEVSGVISVDVPVFRPSWGSAGLDGIQGESTRILFLRKRADQSYEVTDPHHPSLPGMAASSLQGPTLEQVASVECQVTANASESLDDRAEAIGNLRRVHAPCIVPTLRGVATDESSTLRYPAETELMYRGDTASLRQSIADALSDDGSIPGYVQLNILDAIQAGRFDPAAIPLLGPLLRSHQLEARVAAGYVLKNIGTAACDPFLRSLLSDSNQRVRYIAAIALADIAGLPEMHPSVDEFRRNENKYTSHWK